MPDASFSDLEQRLVKLERRVRVQQRLLVGAVAAAIIASAAGLGAAKQKTMTFADAQGHKRVQIDDTGVQMYDPSGTRRVLLGFNKYKKPALYLQDSRGVERFAAYISDQNEVPTIDLSDADDNDRMFLDVSKGGLPGIEFDDSTKRPRLLVGLADDQSGIVHTITTGGKVGTALEDQALTVSNPQGDDRVYLGISDAGNGILKIYDSSARERLYAGLFTNGDSGFQTLDAGGTATWTSP
jgi:hypothetical protein